MAIRTIATILIVIATAVSVSAQGSLRRTVDSLFVIASSGEAKYQDLAAGAKDEIAAIGAEAVPILVDKFTTKSARERLTVIQILTKIGEPAVPFLIRSLDRPEPLVVKRVAWALGDLGEDAIAAAPSLARMATHPHWWVREQSLRALGKIGDAERTPAVLAALTDTIGQVRKAAVVAAGQLVADQAVEQLVHMLGDNFYGARLEAVDALAKLDTALVVKVAADSTSSNNKFVSTLCYHLLGTIGIGSAIDVLFLHVKSPDPIRRAAAAVALVHADPLDNCHFQEAFLESETDPMIRVKVKSAIDAAQHSRE
jgi:HEAT repeat protein